MSKSYYPAGKIVSGRGEGDCVYCFNDADPIRLKFDELEFVEFVFSDPKVYGSDGSYLWSGPSELESYYEKNSKLTFTPQTVARIDILASTTTGPSAANFVKGTLIAGPVVGAAAAMATVGSAHTVKITWKDNDGSKESIITFTSNNGFQTFIGKLGSLMNQPNEATPAPSSPVISSADEILKFKKLMDEGIITPEEFEAKKKQLLGIENTVVISSEADIAKQNSDNSNENASWLLEGLSTTNIGGIKVSPEDGAEIIDFLWNLPDDIKMRGGRQELAVSKLVHCAGVGQYAAKKAVEACMADIARIKAKKAADARKKNAEKIAERTEERREAKEEAKQRFDAYWEAHSDERKELEAEQMALKEQINNLNASLNEQDAVLKKDIAAIPGKGEIDNLDARIKKLSDDIAALGMFKGKEKMVLQGQIVQAEVDKKAIQEKMSAARADLEANFSAIKRDTLRKISQLKIRVQSINTELTKER